MDVEDADDNGGVSATKESNQMVPSPCCGLGFTFVIVTTSVLVNTQF
jgi:hypothetical protein